MFNLFRRYEKKAEYSYIILGDSSKEYTYGE